MKEHTLPTYSITEEVSHQHVNLDDAADFVINRARELVGQLIESRGRRQPPFSPEEFAALRGIKIVRAKLGDRSALLLRFQDGYVIKVNTEQHPYRQNFSCAHEIGHTLIDELEMQSFMDNTEFRMAGPNIGRKAKERLCDAAAAELLMPEPIFREYLARFGVSASSIEWLAYTFKVSIPAVAIRIAEVSDKSCIAIQWKRWQKRKSMGFWLVWSVGPGRSSTSKGYPVLEHTYVRDPSPLLKAYQHNAPVKSVKFFDINNRRTRCTMESKGFGSGNMRYVISLAFPEM